MRIAAALAIGLVFIGCGVPAAGEDEPRTGQPLNDRVARLQRKIDSGETRLDFSPGKFGYLPSLLDRLGVNIDSQVLIFSKTSFQAPLISPRTPRAVFFNDSVAIGSVQGGRVFEITALDPRHGVIFYTLDTDHSDKPQFERRTSECLNCHGPVNAYSPGLMVTSVYPLADGTPFFTGDPFKTTDHRTPVEDRWGGLYVTGTHGAQLHRGNAIAPDRGHPGDLAQDGAFNLTTLADRIDTANYLTSTSDIVAIMTLEHQTRMTNLITSVSAMARLNRSGEIKDNKLDAAIDELVTYMLFVDEAPLRAPVKGVSTFAKTFSELGPRDRQERSLRDFDLKTRLFRYPLSYMIYSEIFDGMEDTARERVYRRLYNVLTGKDLSPRYRQLSVADRSSILEILSETKSNLPAWWKI